ncbi:MAG: c-type cytochrome [Verrucomicrobiales bacterium]|nr:c-type cytochrome [Verrucomicrobiales bacterium]
MNNRILLLLSFLFLSLSSNVLKAVSVGDAAADNSVDAQLRAFEVHPEFEINIFADESMGIANPIAMHWDDRGRLWVLTTLTYAQLEPGENPNDTLVILEDTDSDGRADQSTVFADQLNMPMGFAIGKEGVYLGEGPDLLLLKDTDGDDQADSREVLLTGFGTGDTHQNISNFTWGPQGCLYFAQGLHCYSRVETPWGIVRGDTAGFWRFHPETFKLEPFCFPALASANPCGMAFDKTGALFLKSNNRELIYVSPGLIPTTHPENLVPVASIGVTPGKSMGAEYVESAHLPDWIQNHILVSGYYANRVTAFPLIEEGAGYARVEPVELLASKHSSFRPVETRIGPDGAIYVADWFNPVIGHYQASLRHPDRDKEHGRVWRLTAKGRELISREVPERRNELIKPDIDGDHPRERLEAIIQAAGRGSSGAVVEALKALDHPRDRFIDYALEQTVHALSPRWMPLIAEGEPLFENPEHLVFALETVGGSAAAIVAIREMKKDHLEGDLRVRLARLIARHGGEKAVVDLLKEFEGNATVLEAIAETAKAPGVDVSSLVKRLLESGEEPIRIQALRMISRWRIRSLKEEVITLCEDEAESTAVQVAAIRARARVEGPASAARILNSMGSASPAVRVAMVESLVMFAPDEVAEAAAPFLMNGESKAEVKSLLAPFFLREEGRTAIREVLSGTDMSKDSAGRMVAAMSELGQSDEALLGVLQDAMGVVSGNRAYSVDFVASLVKEVQTRGDALTGKEIYAKAELTCAACHQIGKVGGVVGPPLDAVGAGLSTDLLIESVLWPNRQLKEGYFAVTVTSKSGDKYSGYREKEVDGVFFLRDTATGQVREIPRVEISRIQDIGSLMPQGITNGLSREELRDLIAYLGTLKG